MPYVPIPIIHIASVGTPLGVSRQRLADAPRRIRRIVARGQHEVSAYLLEAMRQEYQRQVSQSNTGRMARSLKMRKSPNPQLPDVPNIQVGWIPNKADLVESEFQGPLAAQINSYEFGAVYTGRAGGQGSRGRSLFQSRLEFWVRNRLGLEGKAARRAAYSIRRKIIRKGFPARPIVTAVIVPGITTNSLLSAIRASYQSTPRQILARMREEVRQAIAELGGTT